jgi:hypothetical protein
MTGPSDTRIEEATERLYGLLPAHIRTVDAEAGWPMKAFFKVLAAGSTEIDLEIDRFYDALFVETAPEGALRELAALVGAEPLRPVPAGHDARAFVANTVRYRRGKGTARVLEALAVDVGGFGAVVVEYFMRLARTQHLIDVRPDRPDVAALTDGGIASRTATGFDTLPRLLDVRSITRAGGRHHMAHVGVHVLRPLAMEFPAPDGDTLEPRRLSRVPLARPWQDGPVQHNGYFQLAAQPGRTVRLFNPDRRSETDAARVSAPELSSRLERLALHRETEELRRSALEGRAAECESPPWFNTETGRPFTIFLRRTGEALFDRVAPSQMQIANLDAFPAVPGARPAAEKIYNWRSAAIPVSKPETGKRTIRCGFDPVTGRLIVAEPPAGEADVEEVRVAYAYGLGLPIGAGPQDRNTDEVPFDITNRTGLEHRVWVVDSTEPAGPIGVDVERTATLDAALAGWAATGAGKRGLIVLTRCDREGAPGGSPNIAVEIHPASELHIVAGQWRPKLVKPGLPDNPQRRGYLVRRDLKFTLDAPLRVTPSAGPAERPGVLVLDGLELTDGLSIGARAVSRLLVRHCTIRAPGGTAIRTTGALDAAEIAIDHSIVGRINFDAGANPANGSLSVEDSIVSADEAAGSALSAGAFDARLLRVTVLGSSRFKSLEATNVIFAEVATVTRRQFGCVRFSAVVGGSSLPRRFRCQPDLALAQATERKGSPLTDSEATRVALGVIPLFLDTALDEPAVAMLHPMTADAIRLGGENDTEMGAFSNAAHGLRMANLASLFDDYIPLGLEAGVIDDTRSTAVATRRNRP